MKKRILSLVLVVVMVLCLVPAMSLVTFADTQDYSVLPEDTNKAHFLAVMEAYGDKLTNVPTASEINEKLQGYLSQNKNLTNRQIAEYMATAIDVFYIDEWVVSDGNGGTTTEKLYDDTLYNSMWEENVALIEAYLNGGARTEANITSTLYNTLMFKKNESGSADRAEGYRLYSPRTAGNYVAWLAVKAATTSTYTTVFASAAEFAEAYAPVAAQAIYDYSDTATVNSVAGTVFYIFTPEAEQTEEAQVAYLTQKIKDIIINNNITSVTNNQTGNAVFTRLAAEVELRTQVYGGGNTDVNNQSNSSGFKYHLLSAFEEANKKSNYGTNKIANFYLNFTDVKLEGERNFTDADTEAAELQEILDYYFAPGVGNYGYYEDLWYDDGHLIFFLDTQNLDQPGAVTSNPAATDTENEPVPLTHYAKAVIAPNTGANGGYMKLTGTAQKSFVKIVGGQSIGKYFLISTGDTTSGQVLTTEVDDEGYLRIYGDTSKGTQLHNNGLQGFSRMVGIYLGYLYDYSHVYGYKVDANGEFVLKNSAVQTTMAEHTQTNWQNGNLLDFNYFWDNGLTATPDANGKYGGLTIQTITRLDAGYWTEKATTGKSDGTGVYPLLNITSGDAQNVYTSGLGFSLLGAAATGNGNDSLGAVIRVGARYDEEKQTFVPVYTSVHSGYNYTGVTVYNYEASSSHYTPVADLGTHMSITSTISFTDEHKNASMDYYWVNDRISHGTHLFGLTGEKCFVPNLSNVNRSGNMSNNIYEASAIQMQDKQMESFRAYDVSLTSEQIARNNFADLAYAKGIDLSTFKTLIDGDKETVYRTYGAAAAGSEFDDITKEEIENKIASIAANTTYAKYADLWYDDGHLMSFVDMTGITDENRAVQVTNYVASHTNLDAGNFTIVTGNRSNTDNWSNSYYRPFIRIAGGQNAGKWYMLTVQSVTDYTFPTAENGLIEFADVDTKSGAFGAGARTGILIGYSYPMLEAGMSYKNGLDAIVADGYIRSNATGNNSFTVDVAMTMNNTKEYSAQAFLVALRNAQSSDTSTIFGESSSTASKQTESNGQLVTGCSHNSTAQTVGMGFGYNGRFGTMKTIAINGDMQLASIVDYKSTNTFLTRASVLHTSNTDATKRVSSGEAWYLKSTEAFDGYPSYGAFADMDTVMAGVAANSYYYYLRTYDVALTAEQMMQNHFADLMYYNGVDATTYRTLSDNKKAELWAWGTDIALSDADAKTAIENKIAEVAADTAGLVNFVGFQARLHSNVGIRSVFYLDSASLEGYTVKAYGALVATAQEGVDFDDITISYDSTNGVIASANFGLTASTDDGFKTIGDAEKAYILETEENLDNYTMFAYTVDYIDGSIGRDGTIIGDNNIDANKNTEMFFRAFAVVEYKGVTYIHYADGASSNYNNTSVSLAEVSNYYATNFPDKFAENVCIKAVVGTSNEE